MQALKGFALQYFKYEKHKKLQLDNVGVHNGTGRHTEVTMILLLLIALDRKLKI